MTRALRPSGSHAAPQTIPALQLRGRGRHVARHAAPSSRVLSPLSGAAATVAVVAAGLVVSSTGWPPTGPAEATSGVARTAALAAPAPAPTADAARSAPRADRDRPPVTLVVVPTTPPPPPPLLLEGCDEGALARALAVEQGGYTNGRLPADVLCHALGSTDERLRADAALALVPLAEAYRKQFGEQICTTDGYRPLAEQAVLRRTRARYAARVGTSEHGWGVAIDVSCGVNSFRTAKHAWMVDNAPTYGWQLPEWARPGGSRPEPWHWEFVSGTAVRVR